MKGAFTVKGPPKEGTLLADLEKRTSILETDIVGPYAERDTRIKRA